MWIRLLGVLLLATVGILATMSSATSAPSDAPLAQATTAVPIATTAVPAATTAVPAATTALPSPTLVFTSTPIPTATQTGLVDLTITKVGSSEMVNTGDQLTYTITVTNATGFAGSTSPATTVIDTVPSGTTLIGAPSGGCSNTGATSGSLITCNVPTLGPNQSVSFTFTVQVTAPSGTVISNTASVDPNAAVVEINEVNNSSTITTTVGLTPIPTVLPTSTPIPDAPITVIETPVPTPVPPTGGTVWVRILTPQQTYSVTDDLLWIAQVGELYWVFLEQDGWLLVVWEGDTRAWSVWIRDTNVQRLTLDRPAPPEAGQLWVVVFQQTQAYFENGADAWIAGGGEWYQVFRRESGWVLARWEGDPPSVLVWIEEGPHLEFATLDAPH